MLKYVDGYYDNYSTHFMVSLGLQIMGNKQGWTSSGGICDLAAELYGILPTKLSNNISDIF